MRDIVRFRLLALASTALASATPAWAQESSDPKVSGQVESSVATAPQPSPNSAPSAVTDEQPQIDNAATSAAGVGDIVVTARRRDERLQDVPVSVSAFSAATLERSTVQTVSDIRTLTPGFTFASEGGKDNIALSLRGIGQIPLGEVTPGVVVYINNVALPSVGSNIPAYDVSSIQVLKGPQGTLFGRNTLGGAVLVGTQAPTYDLSGYVEGTYGRFDYRELEGAINVPIVADKVALRLAGQIRRQDPRTKALDNPNAPGFDDIHQDGFRVSLLLEPTDSIKSTTVYEYFKADELAGGLYLLRQNFPFAAFGIPQLDPQVQGYVAQQRANRFGSFDDGINGGTSFRKSQSITNDTSFGFGDFTVRNIFGYRKNFSDQLINTGAVGPLAVAPGVPFTLFHASARLDRQYLTNEFQFLGNFERMNFIVGAYYNNDKPHGPSGSQFTAFSPFAIPAPAITSHVRNKNYAVFGQVGYKLTDQLTVNVGARYSWDKVSACGGELPTGVYGTDSECRTIAAMGAADGIGIVANKGEEPSWTLGLDYKPNDDVLLYVVTRRGYRGANVNTPVFETGAVTGAPVGCTPPTGGTQCPDLRPFQKTAEEKLTDVEAGVKLDYRAGEARGRLNVAGFYSKYKNALQFLNAQTIGIPNGTPDAPTNGSLGVNVADQTIYGVEVEASISPVRSFTVSFNGAYTKVKVDKISLPGALPAGLAFGPGQVNRNSPNFSGTTSVSWTTPFHPAGSDVIVNADLFMTDDFGGQNGEKLSGYNLVNARLDMKGIAGTGLDLGFYLRNALGTKYFAASSVLLSTFPISSVYVGEPRTWGVSARYRF
jgi:iron complex outermembrane receptor protein